MTKSKPIPRLALKTINGEWSMSLYRALWLVWGVPVVTAGLGYFYGFLGVSVGAILLILSLKRSGK